MTHDNHSLVNMISYEKLTHMTPESQNDLSIIYFGRNVWAPLIPYSYNDSSGNFHWSDVDSDGIPDVVEAMLSNASYFLTFYNFTHYFSLKLYKSHDENPPIRR